ncbi:LamG domain-containing protein [Acidobacteriia bacterium AH_259_A11_L15]|nr:LamG domain-containing protein [Acidobacteriia bacterium AH_259_A11_L15]
MKHRKNLLTGLLCGVLFLVLVSAASAQVCVAPPSGLVSWWPGDGDANDIVGANNGTLQGGATFAIGNVGQAFNLDGIDDHVLIGNPSNLKITGTLTLDSWINTQDLAEGQLAAIVTKWGQSTSLDSYGLWLWKLEGVINLASAIGVAGVPDFGHVGGNIQPSTWSHVAMTYDSVTGVHKLYVNGEEVASRVRSGGIFTSDVNVLIGREAGAPRPFPGFIDEVEIFNRVLEASEIRDIFNAGSAGKCKILTVDIDIKPGSDPNSINLGSAGKIPVAILSTPDFDALAEVDPDTLRLAGAAVNLIGKSNKFQCSSQDVNGDGLLDLVCHFETLTLFFLEPGDTIAVLEGSTLDGTPIRGEDSVKIVP